MKKYSLLVFGFLACQSSTEDRIKSAIEKYERKQFALISQKVESIEIDSIDYTLTNEEMYLLDQQANWTQSEAEFNHILMDEISIHSADSNIEDTRKDLEDVEKTIKKIDLLSKNADTARKLYRVKYRLAVKTDRQSISESRLLYLNSNSLSRFFIDLKK